MDCLPGEVRSYSVEDVFLCSHSKEFLVGQLIVSNYRLTFIGSQILNIPLSLISRVQKIGGKSVVSKKEHGYRIEVTLKDMRNVQFALSPKENARRTLVDRLKTYGFPLSSKRKVFAFSNQEIFDSNFDGWKVFDPIAEYKRILVNAL